MSNENTLEKKPENQSESIPENQPGRGPENRLQIYRKRYIPAECVLLKDDVIVEQNDEFILTTWHTLRPKAQFDHGSSCYMLKEGLKISKFYRPDNSLLFWYCDIVDYELDTARNILTVTDLLADVTLYPDGHMKVLDLDELAEALERGLITQEQMTAGLRRLHHLLSLVYRDKFDRLQAILNDRNL
ncbi:MAG: DUF402 domain-containing protein [Clostridium sp.]|nr:DUF402 domain-containing protein [Acetatifactor muris]MCM1525847.1 DUF402 domain-containing protein [Bacteroides sp.]MCM1562613.1 DUF402 domain-containing protein [Clostridium sp.]